MSSKVFICFLDPRIMIMIENEWQLPQWMIMIAMIATLCRQGMETWKSTWSQLWGYRGNSREVEPVESRWGKAFLCHICRCRFSDVSSCNVLHGTLQCLRWLFLQDIMILQVCSPLFSPLSNGWDNEPTWFLASAFRGPEAIRSHPQYALIDVDSLRMPKTLNVPAAGTFFHCRSLYVHPEVIRLF